MTFAVVAILGHFSKTLGLFLLPQIINCVYSVPQLLQIFPCPRHRLPKYSAETDLLQASRTVIVKKDMKSSTKFMVSFLSAFHLIDKIEDEECLTINNLTLINLFLIKLGPKSELTLTSILLLFQVLCSCMAFFIRYPMASYIYDT